ncbi:MAG TPA: DUF255 domain-containing protein [Gammaproteobacteria bacterium]|jgi:uncharacterized protein YyaL (SSP411 family)
MVTGKSLLLTTLRIGFFISGVLLLSVQASATTGLANQLKNHPSAYLALHGNDPVAWQDWSEAVLQKAKRENKLIFISSGYYSCHWCHVMQRESFSSKEVAELLHQLAIPVKIDRELQPALDSWLIDFTEKTAGQAGWPLNVFLTPDGYPLVGMTYLPKQNFSELLVQLNQRWKDEEQEFRKIALAAFQSMQPTPQTHSGKPPETGMDRIIAQLLVKQAMEYADEIAGGFGDQNKFPMSPQLSSLLEMQASFPNQQLENFLKLTLDQMARLGLRDHVGGGFFRYTVDPAWDIPHFEKMLYDNAQLAAIYLQASRVFKNDDYLQVALDTIDFVLSEMSHDGPGYIASLSAVDDKNVEGGYYLWQMDELGKLLDEKELQLVSEIWGAKGSPYLEAGHHVKYTMTITQAASAMGLPAKSAEAIFTSAKKKLFEARQTRVLPADPKILAAWNGLFLHSISQVALHTGENRYQQAAQKLYALLATEFWDGTQLYRSLDKAKTGGRVSLEDYAYVSRGIVSWARASGDKQAWQHARAIALAGLKRFHNQNGWQLSESLVIPYNARELVLADATMPSPSATLLRVLLDIAVEQGDTMLKQQVMSMTDIDAAETVSAPLWYGTHIALIHQALK